MNTSREHVCEFAAGAPGCGKSTHITARLAAMKCDRIIVIDPDGEYEGYGYLHDDAADCYKATAFPTFRTRFRPNIDRAIAERQFDLICKIVRWHTAPEKDQAKPPRVAPVAFLVDELADFIGPSFRESPASFQWIVKRGRKHGVYFFAASQRPAEISKTLFSLSSRIRTGRLSETADQQQMANALNVPADHVRSLVGHEAIERDKLTGDLVLPPRLEVKKSLPKPAIPKKKTKISRK